MKAYPWIIPCWLLATVLIAASLLQQSEALTFTRRPDKPTIVVEGVNSTNVDLIWDILPGNGESVQNLFLIRQRPGDVNQVQIAWRKYSSSFTLAEGFANEYRANLPATLRLLNVDNAEEYVYTLQVSYDLNNVPRRMADSVTVIVLVPPRMTVLPARQSRITLGTNFTLTCNASGDPTPNITWTKEGLTAAQFYVSGHKLSLVNVKREDVGSYKCTADNGYGTPATSLAVVDVKCPPHECIITTVGITINDNQWPWKDAYSRMNTIEFKMLESNLTSAIASVYTWNPEKQFYGQDVILLRDGSIVAHLQLRFKTGVNDPLKPLRDEVGRGRLGPFAVTREIILNPTTPSPTTVTEIIHTHPILKLPTLSLIIINKDFEEFKRDRQLQDEFGNKVKQQLIPFGVIKVSIENVSPGAIVELFLWFNQNVNVNNVITALKNAAHGRKLGSFVVDADSITKIPLPTTITSSTIYTATATQEWPQSELLCWSLFLLTLSYFGGT